MVNAVYGSPGQILETNNLRQKEQRKEKQTKQLASYLTGFNPPVTLISTSTSAKKLHSHKPEHINTYPQEPKWTTFSRVRPSTPPLSCSFFMKTKKCGCSSWHSGFGRTPLAYLAGEKTGYVIKTHIQRLYK